MDDLEEITGQRIFPLNENAEDYIAKLNNFTSYLEKILETIEVVPQEDMPLYFGDLLYHFEKEYEIVKNDPIFNTDFDSGLISEGNKKRLLQTIQETGEEIHEINEKFRSIYDKLGGINFDNPDSRYFACRLPEIGYSQKFHTWAGEEKDIPNQPRYIIVLHEKRGTNVDRRNDDQKLVMSSPLTATSFFINYKVRENENPSILVSDDFLFSNCEISQKDNRVMDEFNRKELIFSLRNMTSTIRKKYDKKSYIM